MTTTKSLRHVRRGDGRKQGPQIRWTFELRLVLHWLKTDYNQMRSNDLSAVFTDVFENHLTDCGFTGLIPASRLHAQYCDRSSKDWNGILTRNLDELDATMVHDLQERVKQAMAKLSMTPHVPEHTDRTPQLVPVIPCESDRYHKHEPIIQEQPTLSQPRTKFEPQHGGLNTPPATPRTQVRRKRALNESSDSERVPYTQGNGRVCRLTPKQYGDTKQPVVPVTDVEAHPTTVQFSGLLYRTWEKLDPVDHNSETGFWSRRHFGTLTISSKPPPAEHIDATDVKHHLNRDMRDTPFVSTSNRLIWTLRNALHKLTDGNDVKVSVILRRKLPHRVFYARPFHGSILPKAEFTNGAQHYFGTYEFWAWCNIPGEAILHTITLRDFCCAIESDPELSALLRLGTLMKKGKYLDKQREDLARDGVQLSSTVVSAAARLALLLGVNARCPIELRHIVSDIIEGWKIAASGFRTPETWLRLANTFSHAMTRGEIRAPDLLEQETLKVAFLEGVRWSLAKPNAAHTEVSALHKRWRIAGLDSLNLILKQEVDELKNVHERLLAMSTKRTKQLQEYAVQRQASKARMLASMSSVRQVRSMDRPGIATDLDSDLYDHDARTQNITDYSYEDDWRDEVAQQM